MTEQVTQSVARLLETYGGWGLSAILLVGIVFLYRDTTTRLLQMNSKFEGLLRENTILMTQIDDGLTEARTVLKSVSELLLRVEHVVTRAEKSIDGLDGR